MASSIDKHFTLSLAHKHFSPLTPAEIYKQCLDKQRIIVMGEGSGLITAMILHVLKFNQRSFDYVVPAQNPVLTPLAPVVIIEAIEQPLDYKHHIAILSDSGSTQDLALFEQVANATPKGGTLLYPELNPAVKQLASRERTDVQAIPYSRYKHELINGKVNLVTSTNERFPIQFSGDKNLEYIGAARELLKKIGISSGQFYRAISTFLPA